MKREHPRFNPYAGMRVYCADCPYTDDDGNQIERLCRGAATCPTSDTYQTHCESVDGQSTAITNDAASIASESEKRNLVVRETLCKVVDIMKAADAKYSDYESTFEDALTQILEWEEGTHS